MLARDRPCLSLFSETAECETKLTYDVYLERITKTGNRLKQIITKFLRWDLSFKGTLSTQRDVIAERLRWSRPDCFSHERLSEELLVKVGEPWLSLLQCSMYSNIAITETE